MKGNKMKKWTRYFGAVAMLVGLLTPSGLASAAVPYGMDYSGGADLGTSNLQINPTLVDSLVTFINASEYDTTGSNVDIRTGYSATRRSGDDVVCREQKYFLVRKGDTSNWNKVFKVKAKGAKYTREMELTNLQFYDPGNVMSNNDTVAVWSQGSFSAFDVYPTEAKCIGGEKADRLNSFTLSVSHDEGLTLYAETRTKIYETKTGQTPKLDDVYFVMTDIDSAQSYKILNPDNELVKARMFARSVDDLLPEGDTTLRNKYSSSGKYIYSEGHFNIVNKKAHVFVPVGQDAWENGVRVVYGFRNTAGSSTEYYSKQYKVEYKSDPNGVVSGIKKENVLSGENPAGSKTTPNENYYFTHWVADKNVELENGTVITAGKPMTPEQVKNVVVHEDLVFTAYHEAQYKVEYKSDENGEVTGIEKEDVKDGENPTGSETKPNDDYEFTNWTADKDVELEDGTEIKAGTPMTPEQVKKVVVHENLVFTAHHETIPKIPDTGKFTGDTNTFGITTSVIAVAIVAFLAWFAPKLTHKKVKFDKH